MYRADFGMNYLYHVPIQTGPDPYQAIDNAGPAKYERTANLAKQRSVVSIQYAYAPGTIVFEGCSPHKRRPDHWLCPSALFH